MKEVDADIYVVSHVTEPLEFFEDAGEGSVLIYEISEIESICH